MIIRKIFPNIQSAHIVRNCTSERCSHSIHGHSTTVELLFEAKNLDNAQMVMDFGLMKGPIKQLIDSMDHCYLLCTKDKYDFREFITKECDRYIAMPFNPSAEMLATWLFAAIQNIIGRTSFRNGEDPQLVLKTVIYHETASGSAEADASDVEHLFYNRGYSLDQVVFSEGVKKDWGDELKDIDCDNHYLSNKPVNTPVTAIINPEIKKQIEL